LYAKDFFHRPQPQDGVFPPLAAGALGLAQNRHAEPVLVRAARAS
jgi:hypothetical protein